MTYNTQRLGCFSFTSRVDEVHVISDGYQKHAIGWRERKGSLKRYPTVTLWAQKVFRTS